VALDGKKLMMAYPTTQHQQEGNGVSQAGLSTKINSAKGNPSAVSTTTKKNLVPPAGKEFLN
jgi:hypothetical protein